MLYSKMVKIVVDRPCKQLTWNALPSAVCSSFVFSIDLSLGNQMMSHCGRLVPILDNKGAP